MTEELGHADAIRLVKSLFPSGENIPDADAFNEGRGEDDPDERRVVTREEVVEVFRKRPAGNTAPGPDGIPAKILRKVPDELLDKIAIIFSACLREGLFPKKWKKARLVLIPKGGDSSDDLPKARFAKATLPRCLRESCIHVLKYK